MKEYKEASKGIIYILISIICILSVLFVLSLTGEINITPKEETTTAETTEKQYTYDELKGYYLFKSEMQKDEYGNEYRNSYGLYLYDDGTFNYRVSDFIPKGKIGNYIIVDKTIKLNIMYGYGSGAGLKYESGKTELTINSDGTLTENTNLVTKESITLTKNETDESKKNFEENTPNDLIKSNDEINQAMIKNK